MRSTTKAVFSLLCLAALALFTACGQEGASLQAANDDAKVYALGGKNNPPVADAGADQGVNTGVVAILNGSGSYDPDGAELTYLWEFVSVPAGSSAAILNATDVITTFVPDIEGTYEISLTVDDGKKSGSDTVVVSAVTLVLIPDTGQTIRTDEGGPFGYINGLDADYTINPPSYIVNAGGTVTDLVTNLMWTQTSFPAATVSTAMATCTGLTQAGLDDWRLPSRKELFSLLNYSNSSVEYGIDLAIFNVVDWNAIWTSTPYAGNKQSSIEFWSVDFSYGMIDKTDEAATLGYFCVRGMPYQSLKLFRDNGNGTATDIGTGLEWQQEGNSMSVWQAFGYCEGLTLAGHDDWRVPNIKELESVIVDTLTLPAVDPIVFPGAVRENYLSSTLTTFKYDTFLSANNRDGIGGLALLIGSAYIKCVR